MHVITDIFNINIHELARPFWCLALVLSSLCPNSLLASINNNVGIHLAKHFSITSEFSFDYINAELA